MKEKIQLKYLYLCIFVIVSYISLLLSLPFLDIAANLVFLIGSFAICCFYGILSYMIVKRIIVPSCIFLAAISILTVWNFKHVVIASLIYALILTLCVMLSYYAILLTSKMINKFNKAVNKNEKIKFKFLKKYSDISFIFFLSLIAFFIRVLLNDVIHYVSTSFIVCYLHLFLVLPCFCVSYGIYVYKAQQRVFLPACAFTLFNCLLTAIELAKYGKTFWILSDASFRRLLGIIFITAFIFCCIPYFIAKIRSQRKK